MLTALMRNISFNFQMNFFVGIKELWLSDNNYRKNNKLTMGEPLNEFIEIC